VWPDGRSYVGEWRGDRANGHGVILCCCCCDTAAAADALDFADVMMPILTTRFSRCFLAQVHTWPDGSTFEGEWIQDERADGRCAKLPPESLCKVT
jgi:hypothetical protein